MKPILIDIAGMACMVYGAAWIHPGLALIVLGAILFVLAFELSG